MRISDWSSDVCSSDLDFERADRIYLIGGGALYPGLVDFFWQEFEGILEVVVPEGAENCAALGYYLRSALWCGPQHIERAVGLDVGNAYTVLCKDAKTVDAIRKESVELHKLEFAVAE